jgi:hypothetical protein
MISIISNYLFFFLIILGNGFVFSKILKLSIKFNFFELCIFGILISTIVAYILNLFIPLNNVVVLLNLILSIVVFYKNKNFFFSTSLCQNKLVIIFLFLLSFVNIYGSGFSDDLNHYHGGSITNADNLKLIIGQNFLHHHYGYNSSWLLLQSYLNFDQTFLQDIHVVNGICFFIALSYFYREGTNLNNSYLVRTLSAFLIIFFIIKYTRLKEFGLDRPAILIFFCYLIFYLKYDFLLKNLEDKRVFFYILLLFSFLLLTIKIFFIFSFIIPIIYFYNNLSDDYLNLKNYLIIIFLSFIYILKNLLISGCIIYPISDLCIEQISWNSKKIAAKLLINTEASAKSFDQYAGEIPIEDYINNFNWINTWLDRNSEELINFILTNLFCFLLILFFVKFKFNKFNKLNKNFLIFFLIFILNIIIFFKTPVVRYHHSLFLIWVSLIILFIKIYKFNDKKFLLIISIALIFNFSKNINRIHHQKYFNNPLEHVKKIKWYRSPVKLKLEKFTYYAGWIDAAPIGNMSLKNYKYRNLFSYDIIFRH